MTIQKDFYLGAEWDEGAADSLDSFCADVVSEQLEHRNGTYTGNGHAQVIEFDPMIGPPVIMWLENSSGTITTVMTPRPGGNVTAWSKANFTLAGNSGFNTAGQVYKFVLLAG